MSLVIFGDLFSFPEGSAATNRVYTYAKGFKEHGVNVYVICFNDDYVNEKEGEIDGIKYFQPLAQKQRSGSFFVRRLHKSLKFYNTYKIVKEINRIDKIIAINSWSNLHKTHAFAKLLCKLVNAKLVLEISEHPMRFYEGSAMRRMKGRFLFKLETGLADGIFCISNFLINYYKAKGISSSKLILIPSTVDPERFINNTIKPVNYNYVGYFGSLTFDRDDIGLLIRAYAKFNYNKDSIRLVLGGFCTEGQRIEIINLIKELKIENNVILLGYLSREEIIKYVAHADVLVMVRANDLLSQASYPSKLTEFLASSNPVISVNVGEISYYIKDAQDAFLIEPGDENALSAKLNYVYDHPAISIQIGKNGRKLTETIFNYKYQAKRMLDFISTLS